MGRFVIVAYTPHPGCAGALQALLARHRDVLAAENLITERPAYQMQAESGAIVQVFEWQSREAIERAHGNPAVQALWAEFARVCDYTPLAQLHESSELFAEFDALHPGPAAD